MTVVPASAVRLLVNSVTVPSVPVMPETTPVAPAVPLQESVTRLSVVSWTVMMLVASLGARPSTSLRYLHLSFGGVKPSQIINSVSVTSVTVVL